MSYALAPMPNTPHSIIAIGGYGHDDDAWEQEI
jgi:hypothetical protein